MPKKPDNFDGARLAVKYNLNPFVDFYDNGKGEIICPTLPDLVDADLLDCIANPLPDKEIFSRSIQAPAIYAEDIFVSSRKIKNDPDAAFDEAMEETLKDGQPKSIDLISRSTLRALKKAREDIKVLEAKIEELDKRLRKIGK